jgi:hypothetical protein
MTVEGISFILTDAKLQDSYISMNRTFRPNKAGETLLVVKGDVLSGGANDIGKWKVEARDENGKSYPSSVKITTTQEDKITFVWLIAGWTIHQPDAALGRLTSSRPSQPHPYPVIWVRCAILKHFSIS